MVENPSQVRQNDGQRDIKMESEGSSARDNHPKQNMMRGDFLEFGLTNGAGQMNCFMNAALQLFWSLSLGCSLQKEALV